MRLSHWLSHPGRSSRHMARSGGGGTLVFVGLPADNHIQLPIFETVLNGTKVLGSIVGTRIDLQELFELHAAGKTEVVYERRQPEQVNSAIHRWRPGK
jgi:alcohol dehydrogenase, propanol-preferring